MVTEYLALKILAAIVLGGLIGWQREIAHKPAGLRTHILIVLGATVVMDASHFAAVKFGGDSTRIAANIIVGIGFIGAGTIMKEGPTVMGLTSAATIWVDGALGTAIGCGYYGSAVMLTAATMVVLMFFSKVEALARKRCFLRRYNVVATGSDTLFSKVRAAVDASHLPNEPIDMHRDHDRVYLSFSICDTPAAHQRFADQLRTMPEVIDVRS